MWACKADGNFGVNHRDIVSSRGDDAGVEMRGGMGIARETTEAFRRH